MILFASVIFSQTYAQIGTGGWGGGFSGVLVCQPGDMQTVPYEFSGPDLVSGTEVHWLAMDGSGNWVDEGSIMTISPASGTVNSITFNVTFNGNTSGVNVAVSFQSSAFGTVTHSGATSFFKGQGNYAMRLVAGGNTTYEASNVLFFERGTAPAMQINDTKGYPTAIKDVQIMAACSTHTPKLKQWSGCEYDNMELTITQVDPFVPSSTWPFMTTTGAGVVYGPSTLNSSQVADLYGSSGLDISGMLGSTPAGSTFRVTLTGTTYGVSKTSHMRLHVKPGDWDLRMQDNITDNGAEPFDPWDSDLFESPDLWNKLSSDTGYDTSTTVHVIPDHVTLSTGNVNKLLVKVENIGCVESDPNIPLRLFWTRARYPEFWNSHWLFSSSNTVVSALDPNINVAAGSEVTINGASFSAPYNSTTQEFLLPAISNGPASAWQMPFSSGVDWYPPDPADFDADNGQMKGAGHPIICLLARINEPSSTNDPIVWEPSSTNQPIRDYVRNNNNVVTRNTYLVDNKSFIVAPGNGTWNYGFATLGITHGEDMEEAITVTICLEQLPGTYTEDYLDYGTIELGMTEDLYASWEAGGSEEVNLPSSETTLFQLTANSGCVSGITLEPGTDELVGVRFWGTEDNLPDQDQHYTFKLTVMLDDGSEPMSSLLNVTMPATSPLSADSEPFTGIPGQKCDNIRIYPNPAEEMINLYYPVEAGSTTTMDIRIVNMTGQVVMTREALLVNTPHALSVKDLEPGIYLITIRAGNRSHTYRFMKE